MKNILVAILIILSYELKAQQGSVTGSVKDSLTNDGISSTISLYLASDSSLVKTAISNQAGDFRFINIRSGKYFLLANSVGHSTSRSGIVEVSDQQAVVQMFLKPAAKELEAVNITIQKAQVEILADRTVFNIQNTLNASGISGFELLRKAPGIIIDNQDNLIVEGKSGVSIYIDGRPSQLTGADLVSYLKTLQSSDIDVVEIITQPSSRFDAAGNAGIINIKFKRNKNYGTNGTIAAGYAIGRFSKYNSSFSLNNRSQKINIFATYSNSFGKNRGYLNLYRFQGGMTYDLRSFNISDNKNHNLSGGFDYAINKKSSLGMIFTGNFGDSDSENTSRTPISNEVTGKVLQVLRANGINTGSIGNFNSNINYRFTGARNELSFDADYGHFNSDRNSFQPNYYYDDNESNIISQAQYRMITPIGINILSFKADYVRSLVKGKLAGGIKMSYVDTDNKFFFYDINSGVDQLNDLRSNIFNFTERINAGYLNYNLSTKKYAFQAGLRIEYTKSRGLLNSIQDNSQADVKRKYIDLFPSGGFTYNLDKNNSVALIYSKRIDRPSYRSLNPFESKTDELSYSKGNAFLKPQYTDNVKLSHTYKHTLNTSLSYSFIRDFSAQITDTIEVNRNFISPQNIANQRVINLGISYPFSPVKWWNVYGSLNATRSLFSSDSPKFSAANQNSLSIYGQNTFTMPSKFKFEISGWYSSPSVWGGTYKTHSLGSLDAALQKQFIGDRLSIRMSVSDILYTSNWTGNTRYGQLFIIGGGGYESRQFRVNLSYNYGRKEIKAPGKRRSGIDDESGRASN